MAKVKKEKKAFKDTGLGKILGKVSHIIPDIAGIALTAVTESPKAAIQKAVALLKGAKPSIVVDEALIDLRIREKELILELEKVELQFEQEITDRWESDNSQELKLPKLIRPVVLAYSWVVVTLILVLESCGISMASSAVIIGMSSAVNLAYFGSRGYEKIKKASK